MLILEKIQELNELSENIKQSILNAQNEIKKETESKINQEKQTLKENIANELESKKSDLESAAQTKLNEQIAEKKQELEQFISQNLATNAQNISQKLENTAQEALTNAKDKMLLELEKSLRAELETSLNIEIDNIVPALAQEKTEDFLNERANELINYEKMPIDSEKLAKNVLNRVEFGSFSRNEIKNATKNYFLSQKGEETLLNIAKNNAPKIYKDALKQDEILKMRYDCALRLASLKFFGTQEILGFLLTQSAKIVRDSIKPDLDSKTNSFLAN